MLWNPSHILQGLSDRTRKRMDQSLDYFYLLKDREWDVKHGDTHLVVRLGHLLDTQSPLSIVEELKTV